MEKHGVVGLGGGSRSRWSIEDASAVEEKTTEEVVEARVLSAGSGFALLGLEFDLLWEATVE